MSKQNTITPRIYRRLKRKTEQVVEKNLIVLEVECKNRGYESV